MEYKLELNTELRFEVESDASVVLEVSYLFVAHHSAGLNSTRPTQVVWWGKLDPRSDSPARRSGRPANLIAITLFNLDIETKKKSKFFKLRLMLFLYIFLAHFISTFTLYDYSRSLSTMLLFKRSCYEFNEYTCISQFPF